MPLRTARSLQLSRRFGLWPGIVNVPIQATMDYVSAVIEALHAGGFSRVLLPATHGSRGEMGKCVSREIFRKSGKDYRHTDIRTTLFDDDLPAILETIEEVVEEMKGIPSLFAAYQQEMDALHHEKPWDQEGIWTKTV